MQSRIALRLRVSLVLNMCGYGFLVPGPPSSADPANTFRPSGSVTFLALTVFDPSFARKPSIDTISPTFSESFRQP